MQCHRRRWPATCNGVHARRKRAWRTRPRAASTRTEARERPAALPLGDTLRYAPHVVTHLGHRRGVADLQRDFDAAQREAEEIAAPVVTDRIERAFRVKGLGH